ncbi:uncharacterized protein LOC121995932 [Zingiber officinale]|uniref:uncharacterized protein LOC121995932 n=1 Tax=Zingiber officinale TaxID=94328 RepID=UPI001C4C751F|nr:uncharacterized protein LOC121995932 [Zingiber officinale]
MHPAQQQEGDFMHQFPGPQPHPTGMESSSMAAAGDFHQMLPAQQQQGDFMDQHPGPPPFMVSPPPVQMGPPPMPSPVQMDPPPLMGPPPFPPPVQMGPPPLMGPPPMPPPVLMGPPPFPPPVQMGPPSMPPPVQMGPPPFPPPVQMGAPPFMGPPSFPAFPGDFEMAEPRYQLPPPTRFTEYPSFASIESSDDDEVEEIRPSPEFDQKHHRQVNKLIRDEDSRELENLATNPDGQLVNLMGDPLLSVVISCQKTQIALKLIGLPDCNLAAKNYNGDTALHVAAIAGDRKVAKALLTKSPQLAEKRNNKGETPLHKAALYGRRDIFFLLVSKGQISPEDRTDDGATALHCAIMGNAQELALTIATRWPQLAMSRNNAAVTPLQLLVTIPEAFRSQLVLGSLDNLLYNWIPLPKDTRKGRVEDFEDEDLEDENSEKAEDEEKGIKAFRSKFPSECKTFLDLVELTIIMPGRWIRMLFYIILRPSHIFLFKFLWQVSPRVRRLNRLKETHRDAIKLIECIAKDPAYFDFCSKGGRSENQAPASSTGFYFTSPHGIPGRQNWSNSEQRNLLYAFVDKLLILDDATGGSDAPAIKGLLRSANRALESMSSVRDWSEPPLIMGAEMGLHEFVEKILQVCPQSATYLDSRGRNVLQVAIECGNREIVETIRRMTAGDNPVLPSWLLSHTESRRTILHFASERIPPDTDDAVQLQDELLFFETVKEMVPKELVYSRNKEEKTAQEVFSESHKEMLHSCKNQLTEMGKTCAGLVAAVVFASSFSIPGEKDDKTGNPVYMNRLPFKIFSHTYVIGLSCAATSLVLFLSLVISPYKEQQFRRAIPTKYFLACLSFAMALLALLVAFTCNIFLQIYGGQRTESDDLIPLILELIVFPALCFIVLYYRGATFSPAFRRIWK